ncbi:hypothetical protein LXL04_001249 [Taraxacum kok-saghyz]
MEDIVTVTDSAITTPPIRQVLLISAGASHSVALLSGNVVCSWGRGEDGQLGHGDAEDRLAPTQLSALDGQEIVSLTCGADHTTAFSESSLNVYSWGWGDFGRLGHGNSTDFFIPQPIKALQGLKIRQIACGDSHCLAVTMEGQVQSWGRNQNGQLGIGTIEDSLVPQKIEAFQGITVKMVAAGAEHTVAITEDGDLYGWGWGRYGNLGLGDRKDRNIPEKVSIISGEKMVQVACGWRHTISVTSSGDLYTYGWSKYGQLGHGDFKDHLVPHKLDALHGQFISQISGGWRHTMALTSEGKLYGWGWNKVRIVISFLNNLNKLKLPFNEYYYVYSLGKLVLETIKIIAFQCKSNFQMSRHIIFSCDIHIAFFNKVGQISCGWRHTLAVSEKGNVFSWGRGTNGQLGHKEAIDRNIPKLIEVLSIDGSSGQQIESSNTDPSTGKLSVLPSDRYAVVPNENAVGGTNGNDASVPENDVKRIRI